MTSPSGRPITELATATYRVSEGRIVEYWILVDRLGAQHQIARDTDRSATDGKQIETDALRTFGARCPPIGHSDAPDSAATA
jgi:hypothetical protein